MTDLEAAIADAVEAGVGGEQLRNAQERLQDFRAESALEAAEYMLEIALKRANAERSRSTLAELVQALGRATEAGVAPALVKSARNLVARNGNEKEVEMVKLYDRLDRFKTMAEMSSSAGERENAERKVLQAQEKLARLTAKADDAA